MKTTTETMQGRIEWALRVLAGDTEDKEDKELLFRAAAWIEEAEKALGRADFAFRGLNAGEQAGRPHAYADCKAAHEAVRALLSRLEGGA